MDTDDFLEHFGVKGMKWGVRRNRGSNGRVEGSKSSGKRKFARNLAISTGVGIIIGTAAGVSIRNVRAANLARNAQAAQKIKNHIDVSMKAWDGSGKLISQVSSTLYPEVARDLYR